VNRYIDGFLIVKIPPINNGKLIYITKYEYEQLFEYYGEYSFKKAEWKFKIVK
jgi:hypothetical protein